MQTWSRKRVETIALAMLGIASVLPMRIFVESNVWFLAEMGSMLFAFSLAAVAPSIGDRWSGAKRLTIFAIVVLVLSPIVFAAVARAFGSPIAFEVSALSTFGAISLAIATLARTNRFRSTSLFASGFLVLFCASISDDRYAILFPVVWMLLCVWHLIANRWERLDLAMPDSVQRSFRLRPGVVLLTLIVMAVGAYAVGDRIPRSKRLTLGFMPTSGGSAWSDPAARGGVGTGDAAIAAKDHAESFGAVDSDIFLESTESTLFDMVNDTIGEPKVKNKWERRQAMGNENIIPMHEQAARSEKGGGTFSTDRMPPKKHRHFEDATGPTVVQWDGPAGIRLAMRRYDTFDGRAWSQSGNLTNEKLIRVDIGEAPWFFDPMMRGLLAQNSEATRVGVLKVIRLDSQRIPVPMMTAGVHVKKVDRQDFFGIAEDGSFFMPGREKVPPLTVFHVASAGIMEDEIQYGLVARSQSETLRFEEDEKSAEGMSADGMSTAGMLKALVQSAIDEGQISADQLLSCVEKLRSEFTFSRDGETGATSVREFLQSRCGGDHLFATTSALMARELGLNSRLVMGFYVRPDSHDISAGHASVLPQDVHVWAEVQLSDGRWIEIEPTPGYRQPVYRPSWWLVARRAAEAFWPILLGGIVTVGVVYLTRRVWIDWLLTVIWSLSGSLRPRGRVRLAFRIIETRAKLAGQRRPAGKSQRAWLEQITLADATIAGAAKRFCDAADAVCFGQGDDSAVSLASGLVDVLHVRTIDEIAKESTS